MTIITIKEMNRNYKNNGQHAEQILAYTLTGNIRKHDNLPFDQGSDIPEFHMSVKSSGASLMGARLCTKDTKDGIIDEFVTRSASECFAYVVADFSVAYIMSRTEFKEFATEFGYLTKESTKNGGGSKVALLKQSKRMIQWFEGHL